MLYVALLRGINVGGNNLIKMAELKHCFAANGFGNVATYTQSGNDLGCGEAELGERLLTDCRRSYVGLDLTRSKADVILINARSSRSPALRSKKPARELRGDVRVHASRILKT